MSFYIEKKVNLSTIILAATALISMLSVFAYIRYDVQQIKKHQEIERQFRIEVQQNYVTRDQLRFMVIDRLDRFERNMEKQLQQIETKLD